MQTDPGQTPWFRKRRYQLIIALLAVVIALSLTSTLPGPPKSSYQSRLDRTIAYFVDNYNVTLGLISEHPGSNTYWLYSDNYLAQVAILRDDPSNSSTLQFAAALNVALEGYASSLPPELAVNQYTALNSTSASFGCSANYTLTWARENSVQAGSGSAVMMTTANNQGPSCSTENYGDLIFLQAVYYHRLGNTSAALNYFNLGAADFNGKGIADRAFNGTLYQTYKLALYVYAAACLGQSLNSTSVSTALRTLFTMQDNSTGGFYTGYNTAFSPAGTTVNTETTALAALALDQLIHPSEAC